MKVYLELSDIEKLEKAAQYLRDKLMIRLLFRLGCRISELLSIEVKDIDFSNATVTIKHLKQNLKLSCAVCGTRLGRSHTFCPGCGNEVAKTVKKYEEHRRVRTLPLENNVLVILQDYIEQGGPVYKEDKLLLFGINRHRAWQIVKECAERAEIGHLVNPESGKTHNISPHRFRDAFAVHAVKIDDSGDSLRLLQEHLGHQSFNTTAKYRKVAGEEHREWYKRLWEEDKS